MCGIVGYIGSKEKTINVLLKGLERLEYRGYDSAGIAYFQDNQINMIKKAGKLKCLEESVDRNVLTEIGIGHTRWATHGEANEINAHPHKYGNIVAVHNGIIENMDELKNELEDKGRKFISDTDTEVFVAFLNDALEKYQDMKQAMEYTMKRVKGSYAIVCFHEDDLEHLYIMKKDSPLLIGVGKTLIIETR